MPVVLRHNEQLELNLAEYRGRVVFTELAAMAGFFAENTSFLKRDCLSLVLPGADFEGVPLDALDQLFGNYKTIYAPLSFQIVRRSAWICQSPAAQAHVDYWLGDRDVRETMSSTLRQFTSFAEAGEWLVLSEAETVALGACIGFAELARFDHTSSRQRAEAR